MAAGYPITNIKTIAEESITVRFQNDNLETYTLIWLDKNVNETEENLNTQKKLRAAINQLKVIDDCNKCVNYLTDIKDQKMVLIVSGSYGPQVIPVVHGLKQLNDIYVFCVDKKSNEEWSKDYEKVKGVFTDSKQLIAELSKNQRIRERTDDTIGMNIYSRVTTGSAQQQRDSRNAMFMYFQLLIDILLEITDQDSKSKQDLIDHFKQVYDGNEVEEEVIEEYEREYEPHKAIWWYTRHTFLSRTLIKALRDSDYNVLFALRFFITDLHKQLAEEHETFRRSYNSDDPILRVYRGQAIAIDELNLIRNSIGEFLSIQNFLSTNTDREVAAFFAKQVTPTSELTRIVFQFNIDTRALTKPYADIKRLSYFTDEDEVLIMLGSIFKIEQVEYNQREKTWTGMLSMCSQDENELTDLMAQLKEETNNGVCSLGYLLYRQESYEQAKKYFEQLLNESSISDFDKAYCYRGLGAVTIELEQYDEALVYYQKELELEMIMDPSRDDVTIARTYMYTGEAYFRNQDLDLALEYEQKALSLLPDNHIDRATVYDIMGGVYRRKRQYELSQDYHKKGLETALLPNNDSSVGITYTALGNVCDDMGNYQKAIDCYKKALAIYNKSLPLNHPHIKLTEDILRDTIHKLNQKQ
ncbi:unnamed protein product [Didymodactylos carnosus]|uniref:NAD(P)(+)--arginine ADP-ribosyltransferase n=1 Tax=Didymodactylos carnosus TaxID=1234261 RepID=A0A814TFY5_9BILA|nr:unnamed protein product [Didymodactylos carnosus]CAF1160881.1 unnamed protein product [Didymodactylos carnosus]CAF3733307.1 unnamed protein product [Didymodactylos carnosus]CAF3924454.1 unnamed protein product [Didymodactylos carnosus]